MLKIRLARVGRKKRPAYRFIISESTKDPHSRALEILGHYDPFSKVCEVQGDRIKYWVSVGAQVSPTAYNLLVDQNILPGPKVVASKSKKKKGETPATAAAKPASAEKPAGESAEQKSETPAEEKQPESVPQETKEEPAKQEDVPAKSQKEEKPTEPETETPPEPEKQ